MAYFPLKESKWSLLQILKQLLGVGEPQCTRSALLSLSVIKDVKQKVLVPEPRSVGAEPRRSDHTAEYSFKKRERCHGAPLLGHAVGWRP